MIFGVYSNQGVTCVLKFSRVYLTVICTVFSYSFQLQKYLFINLSISSPNIGEGNGKPLQYSCLENPMDGGAW